MSFHWNSHYNLKDKHAILGASNYHWLNYDENRLRDAYGRMKMKERGTRMHALAAEHIELRIKMPDNDISFNRYVNDAIAFRMDPEVILYWSDFCFGTADAISFRKNKLRIHDLKTGAVPASMRQLEIYAAIFCLEYDVDVNDIDIELRIYQNDKIRIHKPEIDEIVPIMDRIITCSKLLDEWENGYHE